MYNPTPAAIDAYARYMIGMFDERSTIGVPTLFQSFFGRVESGGKTLYSPDKNLVSIDIIRGNTGMAKMKLRGVSGEDLVDKKKKDTKFTSVARNFPLIEEEAVITSDELNDRIAGEPIYDSSATKFERLRMKAFNLHVDLSKRIIRTFEYLAAASILTGKHGQIIGTTNTDLLYDFLRASGNTISNATSWSSSPTTAVPIDNLDTLALQIRSTAHMTPDVCIMGNAAYSAFLKTTQAKDLLALFQIRLLGLGIAPDPMPAKYQWMIDAGAQYMGTVLTYKGFMLHVFTYQDTYTNLSAASAYYMPVGTVLLACTQARCDRYFGPSEMLPMIQQRAEWYLQTFGLDPRGVGIPAGIKNPGVIDPVMFYFDGFPSPDQKSVTVRTQAAPIFATTQTDAFGTLTGVAS